MIKKYNAMNMMLWIWCYEYDGMNMMLWILCYEYDAMKILILSLEFIKAVQNQIRNLKPKAG